MCTPRSSRAASASGYESDSTEVTSNTHPSHGAAAAAANNQQQHNRSQKSGLTFSTQTNSQTNHTSSSRWSTGGDAAKHLGGPKDCRRRRRRSNDSGSPCDHDQEDDEETEELVPDTRPKAINRNPCTEDEEEIIPRPETQLEEAFCTLDLQSKPGVVCFETPEEMLSEADDDEPILGDDTAASCSASKTTSSSSQKSICLTEDRVRSHLKDYYEDFDSIFRCGKKSSPAIWESFFQQYYTPDRKSVV